MRRAIETIVMIVLGAACIIGYASAIITHHH